MQKRTDVNYRSVLYLDTVLYVFSTSHAKLKMVPDPPTLSYSLPDPTHSTHHTFPAIQLSKPFT